jgi:predicted RNA-binding Zn ribbon-like protein
MSDASISLSSGPLRLVGGALAVDFVNTADWHLREEPEERLLSYADLLAWAEGAGALDRDRSRRLAGIARSDPGAAERVLVEARRLREALFRLFVAQARQKTPAKADVDLVNRWLGRATPRNRLARVGKGVSWAAPGRERLDGVLAPVLWSAGDVLTQASALQLKLCAAPSCGWLFLDASRKASRLWCSMEGCGNRAKAKRHYRRRAG